MIITWEEDIMSYVSHKKSPSTMLYSLFKTKMALLLMIVCNIKSHRRVTYETGLLHQDWYVLDMPQTHNCKKDCSYIRGLLK